MGETLTEDLVRAGAFEGERSEFDPGEYDGVHQVVARLRSQVPAGTQEHQDAIIQSLPRSTDGEPMTLTSQKSIVEDLRISPDRVWYMDAFESGGKFNCLRITPAGEVFLDVIKPGVHFSRVVQLAGKIPTKGIKILREQLQKLSTSWEQNHPQGFLPEGVMAYFEGIELDKRGETRGGAVFVFDRTYDLKMMDLPLRATLHWVGRHTNPKKAGAPFEVDDMFTFEWKRLPPT